MDEADRPKYFHLLSDREITSLSPVLEILREQFDAVITRWHEMYVDHFGDARALPEAAFHEVYRRDLEALVRNLLEGDMEGFEADMRSLGYDLVERGVPFAEVVASLHLFEESASEQFKKRLKIMVKGPSIYGTFDKLSHCRMILLAGSYFAGHQAETTTRLRGLEQEADRLAGSPAKRTLFHGLVGASSPMRRMYEQAAAAAGGVGAVFVVGESGTGKELVARALHECSGRSGRFVAVNCAALPKELVESELFGHTKGAYTGAHGEYLGLVRSASGGTLFLDEVTEMAKDTQAKLLRVFEERVVRPVGTNREVPVDIRFVTSTNRVPEKAVEAGVLRHDLYYRLNVHQIVVPPLRERLEDVPLLVEHFLELLAGFDLRRVEGVEADVMAVLQGYAWPGNVRELRNAVEHALTIGKAPRIGRGDLPPHVVRAAKPGATVSSLAPGDLPPLDDAERDLIRRALEASGSNKVQAARLLRISRHRLYNKMRRLGLE